jgi:prolyl-tRNA editing enzyme YbaK/EbsC (Cys-tRNA(Pro) deacylase)
MLSHPIYQSIIELLDRHGVPYRSIHHEPARTSEESAKARGEEIRIGGKALLIKVGTDFQLFVLSAARKLDSDALKQRFAVKKIRFATTEELAQLTGLVPGSVPPFGRPVLPFELFVDDSIVANERIAFNAGSLTDSLVLSTADYLRVVQPTVFHFSTDSL